MTLRAAANINATELAERLLQDLAVTSQLLELDLTDCVALDRHWVHEYIGWCHNVLHLRCIACPLIPSLLMQTLRRRLWKLQHIEFTLTTPPDDFDRQLKELQQLGSSYQVATVRRVYVELDGELNCMLLRSLLTYFPLMQDLHVHLLSGSFRDAVQVIREILQDSLFLETFTFSSEVSSTMQQVPGDGADILVWLFVCGNVTFWQSGELCSYTRLRDLATIPECGYLPSQLLLVVEHDEVLVNGRIGDAIYRHDWSYVCCLCLVLFPGQTLSTTYPRADGVYLDPLREFMRVLEHVVELNVSSFHFGPGLDLVQLLQYGALRFLQALSAPPCGLRHPFALRRLAQLCRNLEDLDVRLDRQGRFDECSTCNLDFCFDSDDLAALHQDVPSYRCGLHRLTLSDVPALASLRFLERSQVVELRLSSCIEPSHPDFQDIGEVLSKNASLRYLVLKDSDLPFGSTSMLSNIRQVQSLEYLCLVSAVLLDSHVADMHIKELANKLPRLRCLHAHYRDKDDELEKRITWMRRDDADEDGILVENSPCVLCSTATFIGLVKPRNRGFRATL
ncbi:hypothetical protein HPB49_002953 [Dermacentor silvarum]|uniref:Uncharacterized protein n=1 Tax=Dermacentor silvarum TaxID=543639 RepID=A0ACB8DTI7_DERSI|nr:uncharacterized protein LOC119437685 [Dermacentor silvarum]KAH7977606.1 hypothetical protein HPB49_002953 [Dermacentor silvarum]